MHLVGALHHHRFRLSRDSLPQLCRLPLLHAQGVPALSRGTLEFVLSDHLIVSNLVLVDKSSFAANTRSACIPAMMNVNLVIILGL